MTDRDANSIFRGTGSIFAPIVLAVLAGINLVTVEVLRLRERATFHVLLFMHLERRRVEVAGITSHPNEAWMMQIARN